MSRYQNQNYDYRQQPRRSSSGIVEAGLTLLGGLAIGAGVMYLIDPEEGPSRRKYIRKSTGGVMDSVTGLFGSAYDSAADAVSSARDSASDMSSRAGKLARRSRDTAQDYVDEYTEDDSMGAGTILSMVLGGSALAAVLYMLTTEYDSVRRGDFKGAATNAYNKASDAISSGTDYVKDTASDVAGRATEMFSGSQDQNAGSM